MNDYFIFPVNFEDLESNNYHRHYVTPFNLNVHEKQIMGNLKNIGNNVFQRTSDIIEHENFDYLYALVKMFGEGIDEKKMKILEKLSETLHHIGTLIFKECIRIKEGEQTETLRISYKMSLFLILNFIANVTRCRQKSTKADLIEQVANKDGRKKKNKIEIDLSRLVIQNIKMIIQFLKNTLDIDYKILWEKKQVDPELFKKYTDVCVKILESSFAKDDEVITSIFFILEVILKEKPELFPSIQTVLINLVYESEMIDTLVEFFSKAEGLQLRRLCQQTINCVVIHLMQKNQVNSESHSIKNTRQFLSKLSERLPKMFNNFLNHYLRLYEHESYHLRNAISDILFNILRNLKEEGEQRVIKSRDNYINILIQRIYDKSSFCRWHVIGILNQLSIQKMIPRKYIILFLKAGVDRIKDSSVNTRKKAIQLINTIIDDVWPEGHQLRNEELIENQLGILQLNLKRAIEQEEKIRQDLQKQDDAERVEELVQQANLLRKTIKQTQAEEVALKQEKQIVELISNVLTKMKVLLGSKTDTDVLETIKLFIKFYKRNVSYCKQTLPSIRLLIFSREKKIKDQVLSTFIQLHLNNSSEQVSKELVNLFREANSQDLSALQEILEMILVRSLEENVIIIKPAVFAYLWNSFIDYERHEHNHESKRAIITIMRIAYSKDPLMIKEENIESFFNIMRKYIFTNTQDFHILKEITKILMLDNRIVQMNSRKFVISAMYILVNSQGSIDNEWYSTSEHVLSCIYKISQTPEKLTEIFIQKLHGNLQKACSSTAVAHFIFTLSDSCLKMLIHLDALENKIKGKRYEENNAEENEQEIDKVVGGFQAELEAKITQIQMLGQNIIKDPFISSWVRIIEKISNEFKECDELTTIAVLSYCKFMCINADYCQENIINLFKILSKPVTNSVIKNNIIIAIGDLLHRFPNIIEPHSRFLYQCLHDKDPRVRKTTLTVVTHLSLNDMIKVKSDLCEIAVLFNDKQPQIQALVKQFFHQLNRKDPKILFNMIPEALLKFSDSESLSFGGENTFVVFLQNVLPLMQKDKYSQSLINKLCERMSTSLNILEIKNTAHCLAEINMNEKAVRKVLQNFNSFKTTLETTQVFNSFKSLITKFKKSGKAEIKSLGEELEQKVLHSNQQIYNADEIKKRNQKYQKKQPKKKGPATKSKKKQGQSSNTISRKKKSSRRRKMSEQEGQQGDFGESEGISMDIEEPSQQRNNRPKRNTRRAMIIEQSEEEDELNMRQQQ